MGIEGSGRRKYRAKLLSLFISAPSHAFRGLPNSRLPPSYGNLTGKSDSLKSFPPRS